MLFCLFVCLFVVVVVVFLFFFCLFFFGGRGAAVASLSTIFQSHHSSAYKLLDRYQVYCVYIYISPYTASRPRDIIGRDARQARMLVEIRTDKRCEGIE